MRQKKAAMRQNNSVPTDTQTLELGPSRPVSYDSTANLAVSEKRLRFAEEPLPAAGAASALTLTESPGQDVWIPGQRIDLICNLVE
jgi:hypothetical protein